MFKFQEVFTAACVAGAFWGSTLFGAEIWREAETADTHNWTGTMTCIQPDGSGASGGRMLRVYTKELPETKAFRANYVFSVPVSGKYRLLMAVSTSEAGWASPFSIQFDDGSITHLSGKRWITPSYGGKHPDNVLGWIDAGECELSAGKHEMSVIVDTPRKDGHFICFFDGFLLTTDQNVKPAGNYYVSKQQVPWAELLKKHGSVEKIRRRAAVEEAEALRAARENIPEVWREAEAFSRSNWPDIQSIMREDGSGASGNKVLRIYTKKAPDGGEYRASYDVEIPADGEYVLWSAITPTDVGWASPVRIELDGKPAVDLARHSRVTPSYGEYLGWTCGGRLRLGKGKHTVDFVVDKPRSDGMYICFFDGFLLTTDQNVKPAGNYFISPKQKTWAEMLEECGSYEELFTRQQKEEFFEKMAGIPHSERYSGQVSGEVLAKIMARPLPPKEGNPKLLHRIGLHGMERPFVRVKSAKREKFDRAFELLARAGVDSLRTAETCWHRLGEQPGKFDFSETDYQVETAGRYGMNFLFTIGYPHKNFSKSATHLSTFKPEYEPMFREYLRQVFVRYDKYAQYWEYCNEVDAPHVWWRGATPEEYVRDCRIVREELDRIGSKVPLLGISATYSRDASRDGRGDAGQAFSRRCAENGIATYVDGYSLHYTWSLAQKGFVEFFRGLTPDAPASQKLVNSEEAGYSHPSDVIKLFARDLYLYGFESVYYYIAQDWIEVGNVIYSGLFDLDWNPKLRLASIAAAADAMKCRDLVAMASPAEQVEAYLLEEPGGEGNYAVVLWKNGGSEEIGNRYRRSEAIVPAAVEFPAGTVTKAVDWKLDEPAFDSARPVFAVGSEPLIVYCSRLPEWKRITPTEYLKKNSGVKAETKALLPGQN